MSEYWKQERVGNQQWASGIVPKNTNVFSSPPDDFNKWQYGDFLNNYLNSYWNGFFELSINMWFEWPYKTNTFNVYWYGDKCISYLLTWNYELQDKLITSDAALFQGIILMNKNRKYFSSLYFNNLIQIHTKIYNYSFCRIIF